MQIAGKIINETLEKQVSGCQLNLVSQNALVMSSYSTPNIQINKNIELIFSKFAAWYGHVWRSQFKDDAFTKFAKKEWQDALLEFNFDIINQAILECRDYYEYPPTLTQVLKVCRQIKQRINYSTVKPEFKKTDLHIVKAHLVKCKNFLTK